MIYCQIYGKKGHSAVVCWDRHEYYKDEVPQAFTTINLNQTDDQIYIDLEATSHIINNPGKLKTIIPYKGHDKIFVGNGQGLQISHIGNTSLKTYYEDLHLNNILVVPKIFFKKISY